MFYIYRNTTGGMDIKVFCEEPTEELLKSSLPSRYKVIEEIGEYPEYFGARDYDWRSNSNTDYTIDMDIAREIYRDKLREKRTIRFQQLDIDFMRAIEHGDNDAVKQIAEEKELLRNITNSEEIENCHTIQELEELRFDGVEL